MLPSNAASAAEDVVALPGVARLVERPHAARGGSGGRLGDGAGASDGRVEKRQVGRRDQFAGHHDHQPLDHVAQFADVARPAVGAQHPDRFGRESFRPPAVLARELGDEVLGQPDESSPRSRSGGT